MVSLGSGNNLYEWAGYGKGDIPGRPGMNALRVSTRYEIPHAAAEQLRAIGKGLGVLSDAAAARKEFNITPGGGAGAGTGTAAFNFVDGDKFDISSAGHAGDIVANLRSVDQARKMADFVIVAHHNSTSEGSRSENPSEFVVDFARKAIDAGADMYCGHGWHTFLGIEVYKGKPIIYGMGNFFYQSGFLTRIPADSYESYGFDLDKLTTLNPAAGNLHPGSDQEDWCWSAIYQFKFSDQKLVEIRLYPVETGMDFSSGKGVLSRYIGSGDHKYIDGSPRMAYGASGQEILRRLQQRCALRGTKMQITGNVGVVTI
jgi:poly-gamma-glutamate synthesis protein (capsule biosynthesis protein)